MALAGKREKLATSSICGHAMPIDQIESNGRPRKFVSSIDFKNKID